MNHPSPKSNSKHVMPAGLARKKVKAKLKIKKSRSEDSTEKPKLKSESNNTTVVVPKNRDTKPQAFQVAWNAGTTRVVESSKTQHQAVAEKPKTAHLDLFPWPFEKTRKGIIRRSEWNGLVADIQKAGAQELEAENDEAQKQIKKLLDERDQLLRKYQEMANFVDKFNREFTATYK